MPEITLPHDWNPRDYQIPVMSYLDGGGKRAMSLWHRRAGKDSAGLNYAAKEMFRRPGVYWHLLPTQTQARKVVWNNVDRQGRKMVDQAFPEELRAKKRDDEMLVEFKNGSMWQLAGADNYDSLVGANPVGVIFSEWALTNPTAWDFIRPILLENGGWAWFNTTPRGRNHAYQMAVMAQKNPEWFFERLTVDDTKVLTEAQIQEERDSGMSEEKIQQEYYCSFEAAEAVQFITYEHIGQALDRTMADPLKPVIFGLDVARFGDDRSALAIRHGDKLMQLTKWKGLDTMQTASKVAEIAARARPDRIFVDGVGVGGGVVDRLRQLGLRVVDVNAGGRATDSSRYYNKRAECWGRMRDWLKDRGSILPNPELEFDLLGPEYSYDVNNRIQLEKKDDMKKRGIPSPDLGDALSLTFAERVTPTMMVSATDYSNHQSHADMADPLGAF
ncbi:MAG: hypothetical protein NXI17_05840 [Alphaproteobacteria bacterium]|nr:hypothetical protein [Alphaproteobacteria bacterium]